MTKYSTFKKLVDSFKKKKIMVIGDLLLDHFIWGDVSRISPEAPVPVVWAKREEFMPGGACNVACNLAMLGAEVSLVGVIGDNIHGKILLSELQKKGIDTQGIIIDNKRHTSLKTRVIGGHQQVVRIDREDVDSLSGTTLSKINDYVKNNIKKFNGVIIEDYGKGVINPVVLKILVPLAKKNGKIVAVDPKEDHFSYYKKIDVITPNSKEAAEAVGFKLTSDKAINKAGEKLLNKLKAEVVLITLGEEGMMVFEKGKKPHKIPTEAQEVYDVSGAGDTVIAVYTLSVISGASPITAAHIANCAAGIVVGKVGVAIIDKNELLRGLKKGNKGAF